MKKSKYDPGTFGFRLTTPFMRAVFRLHYSPTVIAKENIPREGALVIACNHKHVLDQCLTIIATRRPINYMAKKEYFEGRLRGMFRFVGCIPVNRNGSDSEAARAAMSVLRRGGALGIFPEGTRNKTEEFLLPFKKGAVSLAQKTGALVVPAAVTGDYVFRSKNLCVRFGKPFSVADMTAQQANERLRDEIAELMRENLELENLKAKKCV